MKKLAAIAALLLAVALAMPASAGTFWHAGTNRVRASAGSTECPAADGWVRLTTQEAVAIAGVPQRYRKNDVDGKPVEMDSGEKAAVDLVRTRSTARSRLLASVTELLASQEVKARLSSAGKSETLIDARISVLDSAITNALSNHP